MNHAEQLEYTNDIAIIGMTGRFPGAQNIATFWKNLCDGVEAITFFTDAELAAAGVPPERFHDPHYVKAGAVLDNIEHFDAGFFGLTPREAEITDPQQRIFLECAWEVLEVAGYDPERYPGAIGVYAGSGMNTYLLNNLYTNRRLAGALSLEQILIANDKDFLTTRVSYKLNLQGPSLDVQTACSTSLVAVHLACQSLLNGECDMALAGGASVQVPQGGYQYREGSIMSPDGHCRPFDAQSRGTIFGNAVAVVLLKRLEDALADGDTISAVIKGSAINNDGALKGGFTAPSVVGQARVIKEALEVARIDPATISYIEAHGTGTDLGDPIEITALTRAFATRTSRTNYCAIGSLKSNMGHLDRTSGVAGLIKTALALWHRVLPPSLHFTAPNPNIDFANSPFFVNNRLTPWQTGDTPRRAGVSSLGIGGTNAHVILEEAPAREPSSASRPWQLLLLSARTSSALEKASQNLAEHLRQHPDLSLADVAYTLQVGRRGFEQRRVLICRDREDALAVLEQQHPERLLSGVAKYSTRPVAFMFPGQGTQYIEMACELYATEPTLRQTIDQCAHLLQPHLGLDLRTILYPSADQAETAARQLAQTALTQPALFVIEYALAQLWMEWGIQPHIMIGHSIGEYVAACLAGVFTLEDALALVAARGRLMQRMPQGAMLTVPLPEAEVRPLLGERLDLAAVNGASLCVVSGPDEAIAVLEQQLASRNVDARRLHTTHAFHSAMMDPILEEFSQVVQSLPLQPPQLTYLSNVTGKVATVAEATDPAYWVKHLRQTVRFADGLAQMLQEPELLLLEVGPGRTLSTLARQHPAHNREQAVIPSLRHPQEQAADLAVLLGALGRLWLAGAEPDWAGFAVHERRWRVPLPTYPFERQRYWIDPQPTFATSDPARTDTVEAHPAGQPSPADAPAGAVLFPNGHQRPDLPNPYVAPRNEIEQMIVTIWQELLGIAPIGVYDDFFELGGHSLLATQIAARLNQVLPIELPLRRMFETHNAADLAVLIVQMWAETTGDEAVAAILDEVEVVAGTDQRNGIPATSDDTAQKFAIDTAGLSLQDHITTNLTLENPQSELIKTRTRQFYNAISSHLSESEFGQYATFLNYGYVANDSPHYAPITLPPGTINRNSVRLILEVIGTCDLTGRDILDISCGRGGTLVTIARYFQPGRLVGGDISQENIAFCREHFERPGLHFQIEDAEQLSFADHSFDIILNIEASFLYPNVYAFYREVARVLRPGGYFLYTDLFAANYREHNLKFLQGLGLVVEQDRDITRNVLLSCDEAALRNLKAFTVDQDNERMTSFLATPGSGPYQDMQNGRVNYRILRLRKP